MSDWSLLDTWIVLTAALAAVACALPGTFLVLRRQSLLGDALSHSVLPGIVLAYLMLGQLQASGWLTETQAHTWRHVALFFGAACTATLSGLLSDILARVGRLDPSASLGVIYTAMFAAGLLLIRLVADSAHIDPDCVLYGNLESTVLDTVGQTGLPRSVIINGGMVILNAGLLLIFFKELQICTFDPALANSLGISASWMNVCLLALTGATVVAAFESVGSILVISMLVVPATCGIMLSDRLANVLMLAATVAILSAISGHIGALLVPEALRWLLRWPELGDASTSGMMCVASGCLFIICWIASPRHGFIRQWRDRRQLQQRIVDEDFVAQLFRFEEAVPAPIAINTIGTAESSRRKGFPRPDLKRLIRQGWIFSTDKGPQLTPLGRGVAQNLVRSHRLWESYLAEHFQLSDLQLHSSAEEIEHFLPAELREKLAAELREPGRDPHGASIPPARDTPEESSRPQSS